MNKFMFCLILCTLLFSGCINEEPMRIQVLDENNLPVAGADVEILLMNYKTDAKGYCKVPNTLSKVEYVTVSKQGYSEVNRLIQFNVKAKPPIIYVESIHAFYNSLREAQMQELLKQLKAFDPNDKSAKMDSLGTWEAGFPGGVEGLQKFINENIRYPEVAIDRDEQGKVYMSFVVEIDGSISAIRVEKGVSKELNAESKRILRSMPRWIPGYANGRPVRTRCRIPIVYTLE